jgi:antitoxin (DNA-binding transcriptional repressor) of toxin-antitoxin stability system
MKADSRSHVVFWRRCSAWKPERRILSWAGLGLVTLYGALGWREASTVIAGVALIAALVPSSRALISKHLGRIQDRRRTSCALLDAMAERAPFLGWMGEVPVGEMLVVKVRTGGDVPELQRVAPALAAALSAREVRVRQRDSDASIADILVVRREPLGDVVVRDFRTERCSLHDFVPLGTDEDGFPVTIGLVGHHLLIGGEPGAGKSGTVSVVLAAAALDKDCDIWCFDGKRVELAAWAPVADHVVGPDMGEAVAALDELRGEMDRRYDRLFQQNKRKVVQGDGTRTLLVVIDELAFYVANADKKQAQAFSERLRDLVARARAAGIVVVAATQKPSADLVPSALRDNFGYRMAHRCATREASDTILGSGWSSEGYSASGIDPRLRGVGYLLAEGGIPRRMRTTHLDDSAIEEVVAEATRRRENRT